MHYYKFNIADYRKDAMHLSLAEHGVYRQLMDEYYTSEKPIETQQVIRRLLIRTEEDKKSLENVLNDFFTPSECGKYYHHKRIDGEIEQYHAKAERSRVNGSKGGRPKKPKITQPVNPGLKKETKTKGNSLTKEPINSLTNNKKTKQKKGWRFEDWYQRYPLKKSKDTALKYWIRDKLDERADELIGILEKQKSLDRQYQPGAMVPHPSTYLNQKRWEDEIENDNGGSNANNNRKHGKSEEIDWDSDYDPDPWAGLKDSPDKADDDNGRTIEGDATRLETGVH